MANLELNYQHRASFINPLVNHYRTYTRVYVPPGSRLISKEGFSSDIDITEEFNRTVFGGFWVVPVGESRTVKLTYELPNNIPANNNYSLLVEKQIGAYPFNLIVDIDFGSVKRKIIETLDGNTIIRAR